jgi:hypothetical protein
MTNSFLVRAYSSKVYIPILTILAFFSGFLDILISVERLLDFFPNERKLNSLKSCFILMLVVILITLPYFFIYYPAHLDVNLSQNETFRLYYIGLSDFGQSSIGEIVNYALFFIKDVIVFIAEIVLSITLVVLLRKHTNKKNKFMKRLSIPSTYTLTSSSDNSATPISSSLSTTTASKKNKSITMMVVVICVFSGFAHVTTIMCNTALTIAQNSMSYSFCFGANFSLAFKSFLNFFIFFFFNKLFFAEVVNLFGINSP